MDNQTDLTETDFETLNAQIASLTAMSVSDTLG